MGSILLLCKILEDLVYHDLASTTTCRGTCRARITCASLRVHTNTCTHTHTRTRARTCTHAHTHTHTNTNFTSACMHTHTGLNRAHPLAVAAPMELGVKLCQRQGHAAPGLRAEEIAAAAATALCCPRTSRSSSTLFWQYPSRRQSCVRIHPHCEFITGSVFVCCINFAWKGSAPHIPMPALETPLQNLSTSPRWTYLLLAVLPHI